MPSELVTGALRWSPPRATPPAISHGTATINASAKRQRSHTMYMMTQHTLTHTQSHTGIHACKRADSVGRWAHACWVDKWWIGSKMWSIDNTLKSRELSYRVAKHTPDRSAAIALVNMTSFSSSIWRMLLSISLCNLSLVSCVSATLR